MWSQDQLDLHVIPGSTDFVVLGEVMPGVDVAFLLDAAAYHTKEDKVHTERVCCAQWGLCCG